MLNLAVRPCPQAACEALRLAGLPPLLARLYAARGIDAADALKYRLGELLPYATLKNAEAAACRLADAIAGGEKLRVVADYDADGATATALGLLGLRAMGARVGFLVPDRQTLGYGLSPGVVEIASRLQPELLVTVDNGIAAFDGIAAAQARGIEVLVTAMNLSIKVEGSDSLDNPSAVQ